MKLAQTSGMLLESMLTACEVLHPSTTASTLQVGEYLQFLLFQPEGGANGDTFRDFIEKCLLPVLMPFNGSNPRSIVVIGNASTHHIDKVVQLVSGDGALQWFLPPYSPDLEPVFSQVKSYLNNNSVAYRISDNPRLFVHAAFKSVTQEHSLGHIEHAGYKLH